VLYFYIVCVVLLHRLCCTSTLFVLYFYIVCVVLLHHLCCTFTLYFFIVCVVLLHHLCCTFSSFVLYFYIICVVLLANNWTWVLLPSSFDSPSPETIPRCGNVALHWIPNVFPRRPRGVPGSQLKEHLCSTSTIKKKKHHTATLYSTCASDRIHFNLIRLCNPTGWKPLRHTAWFSAERRGGREELTPLTFFFNHLPYSGWISYASTCDGRRVSGGNVGHALMHNISLHLYSHTQNRIISMHKRKQRSDRLRHAVVKSGSLLSLIHPPVSGTAQPLLN